MSHFHMDALLKILNEGIDKKILVENSDTLENPVKPNGAEKPKESEKPKRCQHDGCKVKLMLADFACRCKNFYCSQHRFSEAHNCTFNYKNNGLDILAKEMQPVIGTKINKI
jgi:hypothetical protein